MVSRSLTAAKKWIGGKLTKSIKYQNGVSGGSFDGFDTFSTTASNRRVKLTFDPKFYYKSVVLPQTEIDLNATEGGVINLAATELAMAAQEMADELGAIAYSDGTGNGSKDFLGLQAIIDDGTNAATYGSLARSTYTTLNAGYTSQATLTLASMATMYNTCTSGVHKPTIILTTEAIFALYEQLLQPMERINQKVSPVRGQGMQGEAGFTALQYKGVPIVADEKCTSGVMYFINENFLDWYAIPSVKNKSINYDPSSIEGNNYDNKFATVKGLGFSWTDWKVPTNGYSIVGQIILGGNLVSFDPGKHGQLHSISGV